MLHAHGDFVARRKGQARFPLFGRKETRPGCEPMNSEQTNSTDSQNQTTGSRLKGNTLRSLVVEVMTDLQCIPAERVAAVAAQHDTTPHTIAAVLRVLAGYVNLQFGDCYPYQSTISLVSQGLSVATIRRTIRALEDLGILETLVMSDARAVYGALHDGRGNAYRLTAYARRRELPLRPSVIVSAATRQARRNAALATRARKFQEAMARKVRDAGRERRLRELERARLEHHPVDHAKPNPVQRGPRTGTIEAVGAILTPPNPPAFTLSNERQLALTMSEITPAKQGDSGSAAVAAVFLGRLHKAVAARSDQSTGGLSPPQSSPGK